MSQAKLYISLFSGTCDGFLAVGIILFLHTFFLSGDAYAQPQARWSDYPHKVHLNELFTMTLELVWSGEADVYDVPRPDLSAISDFEMVDQSISAARRGQANFLDYGFVLKPLKQGTYDFGLTKVNYYEKEKDIPTPVDVPAALVEVGPPHLLGVKAKAGIATGAVIAICAAASMLAFRARIRSRKQHVEQSSSDAANRARLLKKVDEARRLLIEGDTKQYVETLGRIYESDELRSHAEKIDGLRQFADTVKFSGETPSPDQLKWAEKLVKEAIEHAFPQHPNDEDE